MKLNYSKKILIFFTTTFLVVMFFSIFFSNLLINKISSINDKIKQQNISNQERENVLNLKELIINSTNERTKLEKYFVGSGDAQTADFISFLERLAKEEALVFNIKSVSYEAVEGLNSITDVSFIRLKISFTGKWADVYNYLQTIENLPKIVLVNSVSLITLSKNWSADIDFSVAKLNN